MTSKLSVCFFGQDKEILESLLPQFRKKGLEIDIAFETQESELINESYLLSLPFDAFRFSIEYSEQVYANLKEKPSVLKFEKSVDFMEKKNHQVWGSNIFRQGFLHAISHHCKSLDFGSPALVLGIGPQIRAGLSVLIELGYRKIYIVDYNDIRLEIETLKKIFLGVEFNVFSSENIVLQPGIFSILLSSIDLKPGDALLADLLYFNYLKPNGAIIQLSNSLPEDPLLIEAKAISTKVLSLREISIHTEFSWIQKYLPLSSFEKNEILGLPQL